MDISLHPQLHPDLKAWLTMLDKEDIILDTVDEDEWDNIDIGIISKTKKYSLLFEKKTLESQKIHSKYCC